MKRSSFVAVEKGRQEERGCSSNRSRDHGGEISSSSSGSSSSPTVSLSSLESLSSTSMLSNLSSSSMPTIPPFPGTPSSHEKRIEVAAYYRTNDIKRNQTTPAQTMNMVTVRRKNSPTTTVSSNRASKRPPPPLTLWLLVYSTVLFMIVLVYTETYLWRISSMSMSQSPMSPTTTTTTTNSGTSSFGLSLLPLFSNSSSIVNNTFSGSTIDASISDSVKISGSEEDDEKNSIEEEEEKEENDANDIIHIVHSRFMQDQPHLVELGRARLLLLKQFFLKSLTQQSSRNFVVVIKTDPQLDSHLKQELIDALEHSNLTHVLIASNNSSKSVYQEMKEIRKERTTTIVNRTQVWSGSLPDVFDYLRLSDDSHEEEIENGRNIRIMETRLDADDGLHVMFIESIQADAVEKYDFSPLTWRLWCIGNHIEWQYNTVRKTGPNDKKEKKENFEENDNANDENEEDVGTLVALQATYCVTAGLTIGFPGDVASIDIMPSTQKHERLQHLRMCSDDENDTDNDSKKKKKILQGGTRGMRSNMALEDDGNDEAIDTSEVSSQAKDSFQTSASSLAVETPSSANCRSVLPLGLAAIRARTPTSAGMLNVVVNGTSFNHKYLKGAHQQLEIQHKLWYVSKRLFGGFSKKKARSIHTYFDSHMRGIARENLEGQCTHGHSCKNSSQILLRSIMEGKSLAEANDAAAAAAAAAAGK